MDSETLSLTHWEVGGEAVSRGAGGQSPVWQGWAVAPKKKPPRQASRPCSALVPLCLGGEGGRRWKETRGGFDAREMTTV